MYNRFLSLALLALPLVACNKPAEKSFTPEPVSKVGSTTLRLNYVGADQQKLAWQVDGRAAGKNSRAAVSLSRSKHELVVSLADQKQTFWLDAATDMPLFAEFTQRDGQVVSTLSTPDSQAASQNIYIKSEPSGANVFVNRRLFGNTPVAIGLVSPGQTLEIILTRPGFRNTKVDYTVVAGQRNQVVIPMTELEEGEAPTASALPRPKTTLSIDTPDSPGTKILLNGIDIKRVTPQKDLELPIGLYQVTLVRQDGSSLYFKAELEEGKPTVIKENIKDLAGAAVRPGSIIPSAITEDPEGAEGQHHGHHHHH